jgi:predicted transcriptional regulator
MLHIRCEVYESVGDLCYVNFRVLEADEQSSEVLVDVSEMRALPLEQYEGDTLVAMLDVVRALAR